MPKSSNPYIFLRALTELRDEQRAAKTEQLHVNIRAYVNWLVKDLRAEFTDSLGQADLARVRAEPRSSALRQHGEK